eukprot:gene18956-22688_t
MKKDFRTAYLNTLGFKGGQLKTSLEAIFEHRVIDLNKLKKICNIFEIPSQYRCRVWKILLGVSSSYQETWDFIQEQRTIEYDDLKHAVNLVRRGTLPEHFYNQCTKWFKTYFTCCFPTTSLTRVWDRIIGVSLDYMAFIALAILQSKKSIIFEKNSGGDILNYLLNVKDINMDMVLEKSVEYYTNSE